MPSPEDLKRISGAISSDPAAFLPQLLSYIEKSVKECYDKSNEVSPCQTTLPHLDNRISWRNRQSCKRKLRYFSKGIYTPC